MPRPYSPGHTCASGCPRVAGKVAERLFCTPLPGSTCILRFSAGPPYEDIAFRILNKEWCVLSFPYARPQCIADGKTHRSFACRSAHHFPAAPALLTSWTPTALSTLTGSTTTSAASSACLSAASSTRTSTSAASATGGSGRLQAMGGWQQQRQHQRARSAVHAVRCGTAATSLPVGCSCGCRVHRMCSNCRKAGCNEGCVAVLAPQ